jgi:hypothetical protein
MRDHHRAVFEADLKHNVRRRWIAGGMECGDDARRDPLAVVLAGGVQSGPLALTETAAVGRHVELVTAARPPQTSQETPDVSWKPTHT